MKKATTTATATIEAKTKEIIGVLSSQNIVEFASTLTFLSQFYKKTNQKDIINILKNFENKIFRYIFPKEKTFKLLNDFLNVHPTTKKQVFDMFLVATMLSNGVNQILTYNTKDFYRFKEIKVILP